MKTDFVYRRVVNGNEICMPELEALIEKQFPNHQERIDRTLGNFGMDGWRVIINPGKAGGGALIKFFKWIILMPGTETQMRETLYHEIFHWLCPEALEDEIEAMGVTFNSLVGEL